jgi:hypothetical protein
MGFEVTLTMTAVEDSLTVEFSRSPGKTFHRKVLSKFFNSHVISIRIPQACDWGVSSVGVKVAQHASSLGQQNPTRSNLSRFIYPSWISFCHIRPQTEENWASRPLCHTQASDRQISSWVGDHQRIPAVVCFLFLFFSALGFLFHV